MCHRRAMRSGRRRSPLHRGRERGGLWGRLNRQSREESETRPHRQFAGRAAMLHRAPIGVEQQSSRYPFRMKSSRLVPIGAGPRSQMRDTRSAQLRTGVLHLWHTPLCSLNEARAGRGLGRVGEGPSSRARGLGAVCGIPPEPAGRRRWFAKERGEPSFAARRAGGLRQHGVRGSAPANDSQSGFQGKLRGLISE